MPRYFFLLKDGERIADKRGLELPDDNAAREIPAPTRVEGDLRFRKRGRSYIMLTNLKSGRALAAVWIGLGSMTGSASAVTAEVAKNCAALTAKAFPPRVVGNPAAGSAKGSGQSEQSYFSKCLENGGNIDESRPSEVTAPPPGSLPQRQN
jgi:hypothetical protein